MIVLPSLAPLGGSSAQRADLSAVLKVDLRRRCGNTRCVQGVLRIVRIDGGLVLLEKQKTLNGVLVPVAYDQGAHDYVPSFITCRGASTLSHTQKEFIVKHGRLDRNRE